MTGKGEFRSQEILQARASALIKLWYIIDKGLTPDFLTIIVMFRMEINKVPGLYSKYYSIRTNYWLGHDENNLSLWRFEICGNTKFKIYLGRNY